MLTTLLIAVSIGLDNFAASIAIGLSGLHRRLRLRIALVFGAFEAGMPLVGLLVGRSVSHLLGGSAHIVGGALLIATGAHALREAVGDEDDDEAATLIRATRTTRLLVLAAALSIDNLIVGFALGAGHAPLVESIVVIAVVSVALSLLGLELGSRLGARIERSGEMIGGGVLVAVGIAVLTGAL